VDPVRYAYRSFDRHWVLPDARLGDFMRAALWRVAGPRQIFLTSLLTNVLGPGPAVVATAHVPDLDHFRGSFGARAVIPLWCDAAARRPNVSVACVARLSRQYGFEVDAEMLMAYCYALLATRGYVERFYDELRIPGPRVPLTADGRLFRRCASSGGELLALHTYQRVLAGAARCVTTDQATWPRHYAYDRLTETLVLGDMSFGPLSEAAWEYTVSGYRVIPGWLRQRVRRRARSSLEELQPERWTPTQRDELLELIWVIEATLAAEPALDVLLDQVIAAG
jgi:predicted helicase